MRINVVLSLLKKEFLNIIRDKKSFLFMILLPLLMFPIMIGLMSLMMSMFTKIDDTIKFGVNYELTEEFKTFVNEYSDVYKFEIVYENEDKLKELFDDKELNIYVTKDNNEYSLHYDANSTSTIASSALVENIYKDYQDVYITKLLANEGIDYNEVKNSFSVVSVQESITDMGSLVPSIIAMVLTMIISSVSFSVAIDVTTSEKEKGTLETLLSLPITKSELITSKYITVFALSALSGFLTYISLFGTIFFAKDTLAMLGVSGVSIGIGVLLIYLVSIILLALLFSGLLLGVTIFSKTLKEAQNSLYPLEILVTFVSMLPMLGVSSSLKYACIPFVNISLLFNNALSTNIDALFVLVTFLSSLFYAIVLIWFVSKIYNQEDILFNSKSMSAMVFRNGKSKREYFSPFLSIVIAVLIYLLALYFSMLFLSASPYVLLAIMPLTIIFVVVISALLGNLDMINSFRLKKFSLKKFIVLIFFYFGMYVLATCAMNVVANLFPSLAEEYSHVAEVLTMDNFILSTITIALLPAVAEELLFRGVILTSFKKKYGAIIAVIISALIFGIYHMNWVQGIYASILGIALGFVYVKTGSLFATIILHFLNNFYAVLINFVNSLNFEITNIMVVVLLVISIIFIIASVLITQKMEKRKE